MRLRHCPDSCVITQILHISPRLVVIRAKNGAKNDTVVTRAVSCLLTQNFVYEKASHSLISPAISVINPKLWAMTI